MFDANIERVEVINCSNRELNCAYLSWIGASVIPKLDCMKEGFITRDKWLSTCINSNWDYEVGLNAGDGDNLSAFEKKMEKKEKSSEFGITYMKEKLAFQW